MKFVQSWALVSELLVGITIELECLAKFRNWYEFDEWRKLLTSSRKLQEKYQLEKSRYLHSGVVVMKINKVIHLINIIKLSVCIWWNFTLNLLKHLIFSTFLNELLFTISDNIFQYPRWWVEKYVLWMLSTSFLYFFLFLPLSIDKRWLATLR